jgi:hypothetical protein
MSRTWRIEFKDTVLSSNLQELPENDRVRYTISPNARKEILKCLLKLNHEIHEQGSQSQPTRKRKNQKEI